MATRNRTPQYAKLREQYTSKKPSTSKLLDLPVGDNTYNYVSAKNLLDQEDKSTIVNIPPEWLARVSDVQHDISKIKTKMVDLSELHKKHLLPGFDDRMDEEHAIEIQTGEITKLFHQAQGKIKQVGMNQKLTQEHQTMKTNIQSALAVQIQEFSVTFRNNQKQYLQALRSRQKKGKSGSGFISFEEEDIEGYEDKGFTPEQLKAVDDMSSRITQRERDIIRIAKSITELAEIFKDLSILVIDQGTILDRIDYNIEQTSQYVDEGVVQLGEASHQQKKYRNKLCMLALLILILVVAVVIIIKATAFGKNKP